MKRNTLIVCLFALLVGGCSYKGLVLYNWEGDQRVWPHFVDQVMVLAFWSPASIHSIEDMPALNALTHREGPVHLMSICSSPDRARAVKWMRKEKVVYEVVFDPDGALARKLSVSSFPTYILFDRLGEERERSTTIRNVFKWFDKERFHEEVSANYN